MGREEETFLYCLKQWVAVEKKNYTIQKLVEKGKK